jgi:hypothetical protein
MIRIARVASVCVAIWISFSAGLAIADEDEAIPSGAGLTAEYFGDDDFGKRVFARRENQIDMNLGYAAPDDRLPVTGYSVRWSGFLKAKKPGMHEIVAYCDGGVRLVVGGKKLIDRADGKGGARIPVNVELKDKPTPIVVELRATAPGSRCTLSWKMIGEPHEVVVPTEAFATDERGFKRRLPARKSQNGLLVEIFRGQNFEKSAGKTTVDGISTFMGYAIPFSWAPHDDFSIRYTGWIQAPKAGRYKIYAAGDDGCRLWLDGTLIIDQWSTIAFGETTVEFGTEPKRLRFEGHQSWYNAAFVLYWQPPDSQKPIPIPPTSLFLPSAKFPKTRAK